ncbi:hypothetical protein DU002_15470 [Corallincola holothuriorum]|uniref:Uncharacterized protein n=1 Tax=Corallincola holothuriorum TaxID=2282215 RepID=A0A368N5I0_9GAMM|nr:hypothetical protein DU002_15470 [Corallincola holothuriorum]
MLTVLQTTPRITRFIRPLKYPFALGIRLKRQIVWQRLSTARDQRQRSTKQQQTACKTIVSHIGLPNILYHWGSGFKAPPHPSLLPLGEKERNNKEQPLRL